MNEPSPTSPTSSATSPHTCPAAYDWAGARGEKWRAELSGMEGTLLPVDEPLIRALSLDAPYRIADVACGGGGTTLEIRRQAREGSMVHGFDISPPLVEVARQRARGNERAIAFELADVATAPPPEPPYDRLVSRFGTMFFVDPPAAFANLACWLRPGGRFAFAVWGPTADNPWIAIAREATAEVVEVPAPDPESPGPFRYADASKLRALLERAGFRELDVQDWRGALPIGGGLRAIDAATFSLATFSSFGELLAEAGEDALRQARQSLTARLARHEVNGTVRIDARVHIFTGTR